MIEATTKLNNTWNKCTNGIDKEDLSADVYNCACEIDAPRRLLSVKCMENHLLQKVIKQS